MGARGSAAEGTEQSCEGDRHQKPCIEIFEIHQLGQAEFLSFFPRRWKAGGVGIQANQKTLDEEGQLAGKEESRVQCEGAGGGRLVEVKPRIGAKMARERVGVREVKEQMTSTARKPGALNQQAGLWQVEETQFRKET